MEGCFAPVASSSTRLSALATVLTRVDFRSPISRASRAPGEDESAATNREATSKVQYPVDFRVDRSRNFALRFPLKLKGDRKVPRKGGLWTGVCEPGDV